MTKNSIDILSWPYRISDFFRNLWYGRVTRKHWQIRTKLPKTSWIDSDTRMLYGMMTLLDEFYKNEMSLNIVDWEHDEYHRNVKKELDSIKAWWDNYPNRLQETKDNLSTWYDYVSMKCSDRDSFSFIGHLRNDPKEKELFNKISESEDQLQREEQEMLHKLVDLRFNMWT